MSSHLASWSHCLQLWCGGVFLHSLLSNKHQGEPTLPQNNSASPTHNSGIHCQFSSSGIRCCHWVIRFLYFKTILPQNIRNQLPSDVMSYLRRMQSSATPQQWPDVCSPSKVMLKISLVHIHCSIKYTMNSLYRWKTHRLCVQHFKPLYENAPCPAFLTVLDYHPLYSQYEWKGAIQLWSTYTF
jgi:hypothetical protein